MDWGLALAGGLYLLAVAIAAARSRSDDWDSRQIAGAAVFLAGAAVALFLDDAIANVDAAGAALATWSEPLGVAIMLVGGLVVWRRGELDVPGE